MADRRRRRRDRSLFTHGVFVAVDGEGVDIPPRLPGMLSNLAPEAFGRNSRRPYEAAAHEYRYFATSTGHSICRVDRVTLLDVIEILEASNVSIRDSAERPIFVGFGLTYDITHWLAFDLDRVRLDRLMRGKMVRWKAPSGALFRLEWRSGHYFRFWRRSAEGWLPGITVWDIYRFFRCSFIEAVERWLDPWWKTLPLIREGKATRGGDFDPRYVNAELGAMVEIMERLRGALAHLGLRVSRWSGAGAIAGLLMQRAEIRRHKGGRLSFEMADRVCRAYFGGRVEAPQIGYGGPVWRYDIRSAYPSALAELPSLAAGSWERCDSPDGFYLAHISWDFPEGAPFYPFLFRADLGGSIHIVTPLRGSGWHWAPDIDAARAWIRNFGGSLSISSAWRWNAATDQRPFSFVRDWFRIRAECEDERAAGLIKIGLNAIWGKTCQQLGFSVDRETGEVSEPTYFNLVWAGWVTSRINARLVAAALKNPGAIIAFCTDGLLASEPLGIKCGEGIGDWREECWPSGTHLASGIYWLHGEPDALFSATRGFRPEQISEGDAREAWRENVRELEVPVRRFVTIGAALQSDEAWKRRGRFAHYCERVATDGTASKRGAVRAEELRRAASHFVSVPHSPWFADGAESAPHYIDWSGEDDPVGYLEEEV